MFEIATRQKFRFPYHGSISVEDLWDLTPANLDTVYKALNSQKKQTEEESHAQVPTCFGRIILTNLYHSLCPDRRREYDKF